MLRRWSGCAPHRLPRSLNPLTALHPVSPITTLLLLRCSLGCVLVSCAAPPRLHCAALSPELRILSAAAYCAAAPYGVRVVQCDAVGGCAVYGIEWRTAARRRGAADGQHTRASPRE